MTDMPPAGSLPSGDPLSEEALTAIAEMLRTIGHETRLRLIDTLRVAGERSVGELEQLTGIGQPGLSQQLAVLRKAELVHTRRSAKQVYYSLAPEAFHAATLMLARIVGERALNEQGGRPNPVGGSAAMFARIL